MLLREADNSVCTDRSGEKRDGERERRVATRAGDLESMCGWINASVT